MENSELSCGGSVRHFTLTKYIPGDIATILFDAVQENGAITINSAEVNLKSKDSGIDPGKTADKSKSSYETEIKLLQTYQQDAKYKELIIGMTSLPISVKHDKSSFLGIFSRVLAEISEKGTGIKVTPTISFWDTKDISNTLATSSAGQGDEISFYLPQDLNSLEHLGLGVQLEAFFIEPSIAGSQEPEFVVALFVSVESKLILFKYSLRQEGSKVSASKILLKEKPLVINEVFGPRSTSDSDICKHDIMQQSPEGLYFFSPATGKDRNLPFTKRVIHTTI